MIYVEVDVAVVVAVVEICVASVEFVDVEVVVASWNRAA